MAKASRASITLASTLIIPLITVAIFGIYLGTMSATNAPSSGCAEYSCVQISINSNSPITSISVSLVPEQLQCALLRGCDPSGPQCSAPSNFCFTVNTQTSTDSFTFNGVKQGYYWLEFSSHVGTNATRGTSTSIHVENQGTYYVTANITAGLSTAKIGVSATP